MQLSTIYQDNFVSVRGDIGRLSQAERVLLSFTGIGHGMGAITHQDIEFSGTGANFDGSIFIVDRTRSWGNRVNFGKVIEEIYPFIEGRDLTSIGNSMGGFLSILITKFLKVKTCISFVPQFSVSSAVMPEERRWQKLRDNIVFYMYPDLSESFSAETKYFAFFGLDDISHMQKFPMGENIKSVYFRECGHDVASYLKSNKLLWPTINSCILGDFDCQMINKSMGRAVCMPASGVVV